MNKQTARIAVAAAIFGFGVIPNLLATLITYPDFFDSNPSRQYFVTVDGSSITVESYKDICYARFAFDETVNIVVTVPNFVQSIDVDVSPHSYGVTPVVNGTGIAFSLTHSPGQRSRRLVVRVAGLPDLYIWADKPEENAPDPDDPGVLDAGARPDVDPTGQTASTTGIQSAIDEGAALGKVVFVPNGTYLCGGVQLRNNSRLYLSAGAKIKGTGNLTDYQTTLADDQVSQILVREASGCKIFGRGAIDANGTALRVLYGEAGRGNVIRPIDAVDLTVEDVILLDPGSWTMRIRRGNDIRIVNTKIVAEILNPAVTNTDGINPDGANRVAIIDNFARTGDDSVSPKSSNVGSLGKKGIRPCHDVFVINNVFWTDRSALKPGTECFDDIYNVYFLNNDILFSDRFIAAFTDNGAGIHDIYWISNRSERINLPPNPGKHCLFFFRISEGNHVKWDPSIYNITIQDTTCEEFGTWYSQFEGLLDQAGNQHFIENAEFSNLNVGGGTKLSPEEAQIDMNPQVRDVGFSISDDFEDGDSNGWRFYGGTYQVVNESDASVNLVFDEVSMTMVPAAGNRCLELTGPNGARATFGSSDWSDVDVEADIKINKWGDGSKSVGLLARFVDPSNHYEMRYSKSASRMELRRRVAGTYTVLATAPMARPQEGVYHHFCLSVRGNTLTAEFNGVTVLTYTETITMLSKGKAGLWSDTQPAKYDGVRVSF